MARQKECGCVLEDWHVATRGVEVDTTPFLDAIAGLDTVLAYEYSTSQHWQVPETNRKSKS